MKNRALFNKAISLFLVTIFTAQIYPVVPTRINLVELDGYFKRLTRGMKCLLARKPCKPEDKKVVWQAGGAILTALGLTVGGIALYVNRKRFGNVPENESYREKLHFKNIQEAQALVKKVGVTKLPGDFFEELINTYVFEDDKNKKEEALNLIKKLKTSGATKKLQQASMRSGKLFQGKIVAAVWGDYKPSYEQLTKILNEN